MPRLIVKIFEPSHLNLLSNKEKGCKMNFSEHLLDFKYYKLHKQGKCPTKKPGDLGWDISCVEDDEFSSVFTGELENRQYNNCYELEKDTRHVFHTGISIELPISYHGLLWPRSGLAVKDGIGILAGLIDNSYRGELLVCLHNLSHHTVRICPGDRIVQMIILKEHEGMFSKGKAPTKTSRGSKGFGSSGR